MTRLTREQRAARKAADAVSTEPPTILRFQDKLVLGRALSSLAAGEAEYEPKPGWDSTTQRLLRWGVLVITRRDPESGHIRAVRALPDVIGAKIVGPAIAMYARRLGPPRKKAIQLLRLTGEPLRRLRDRLRDRDGDDCCRCGETMVFDWDAPAPRPPNSASVEHGQIPFSIRPIYEFDELSLSCVSCNKAHGHAWRVYRCAEARLRDGKLKSVDGWPALWDADL